MTSGLIYTIDLSSCLHIWIQQGSHFLSCPPHQWSSPVTAYQPPQCSVQGSRKLNSPAITFCHSFQLLLCLSLCNSALSQAQRRGAALSWLTKPLVDQTLQHGLPLPCDKGGMSGGDCSAPQHVGLWLGMCPQGFQDKILPCSQHFTELELLSSFSSVSCYHCLVKLQIPNTSSPVTACGSLCKFCCNL